jgi:hypothetical protein
MLFVVLLEEGYLGHLSLKVGSIFEETAFVELVEFIPYLLPAVSHLLVVLFGDYSLILGELFVCLLLHLFCEVIEDDMLFGTTILVELDLTPNLLFWSVFLHC